MAVAGQLRRPRPSLMARLREYFRITFLRGDLTSLIFTCGLMIVPALALSQVLGLPRGGTTWNVGLGSLVLIAVLSVVTGFLLARSRYGEIAALLISSLLGIVITLGLQFLAAPGDPISRVAAIASRIRGAAGGNQDPIILVLFMSSLFWYLGHNTTWHIFRIDRIWRALIPPAIVLLINGLYNFGATSINLDLYLITYLFFALMLFIRSHLDAREYDWYVNRIRYDVRMRTWVLRVGSMIGVLLLLTAWVLPTGSTEENQKRFEKFVNGDLFGNINKIVQKLFAPLEGQGTTAADYYGKDELFLSGAIQLGDQNVMIVKVPAPRPRYYWKSRSFDLYINGRWTSLDGTTYSAPASGVLDLPLMPYQFGTRQDVTQTFTMLTLPSRLIYAAPQVRQVRLASQVEASAVDATARTLNPSVVRPLKPILPGDSYTVTSSLSVADEATLRSAANSTSEAWLTPYKTIDANIAPRTRNELLAKVVQGQITNYDKAKAIETYLRQNIKYNEAISAPPPNRDLVDWVIFDKKEGYCTYYATAMVVMLRQLGIPSRMAAGFSQGILDTANNLYTVREKDAHTWVEVYFPGAGWVEFEPTQAQQNVPRSGEIKPSAPPPTFTPSPTPSLTPTPPPTEPPPPQQAQNQPTNAATETPLPSSTPRPPTPTPTATPVPPLIVLPDLTGPANILLILSLIVGSVAFIGVGLFWWIEYRGLDRLSPVGRAYARLGLYSRWLRIPSAASLTPLERGRAIAKELPQDTPPVATITDMYIHERYAAPRPPTPLDEQKANRAWSKARAALIRRRFRRIAAPPKPSRRRGKGSAIP